MAILFYSPAPPLELASLEREGGGKTTFTASKKRLDFDYRASPAVK
jgi:hypothetical protein